jgi:glycine oxidase
VTAVAVLGGGIIGLSIAWRLLGRGIDVTVHDDHTDEGAWYAAAGMLAPVGESTFGQTALTSLLLESARRWPAFAEELGVGRYTTGTLAVARGGDDLAEARRMWDYRRQLGLGVEELTASTLRDREPALSPRVRGGASIPEDHQVDPRKVVAALREKLRGSLRDGKLDAIPEGRVVVAAGVGTAGLTGLPVRPVKGLTLRLRGEPGLLRHVINGYVDGRHVYLVPRPDGEIVVGASQEERTDSQVTAGPVLELLRSAVDLVPDLAECEVTGAVVRHRPATPDNAPLLGTLGDGVIVAAGHHRNGVLLAPVTADLVADLVVTGRPDPLLTAFAPGRFA